MNQIRNVAHERFARALPLMTKNVIFGMMVPFCVILPLIIFSSFFLYDPVDHIDKLDFKYFKDFDKGKLSINDVDIQHLNRCLLNTVISRTSYNSVISTISLFYIYYFVLPP